MLILERLRRARVPFAAHRLRRNAPRHRLRLEKRERRKIHAEIVFGAVANPRFGVDGAGEVSVQVGAFGHSAEKFMQLERIRPRRLERARGATFAGCGLGGLCFRLRCFSVSLRLHTQSKSEQSGERTEISRREKSFHDWRDFHQRESFGKFHLWRNSSTSKSCWWSRPERIPAQRPEKFGSARLMNQNDAGVACDHSDPRETAEPGRAAKEFFLFGRHGEEQPVVVAAMKRQTQRIAFASREPPRNLLWDSDAGQSAGLNPRADLAGQAKPGQIR